MGRGKAAWLCAWLIIGISPPVFAQSSPVQPPLPALAPNKGASNAPSFESNIIGVPYLQAVRIPFPGASRVLSVDPAVIEAKISSPGIIELRALSFGQTFVHIWTPSGRATRAVQTTEVLPAPSAPVVQSRRTAQDVARDLTFEYENRFRTQQRGPQLSQLGLNTTTQFFHLFSSQMDIPLGHASGSAAFQRINSFSELSTWNAALRDGDIGFFEHFDVEGGDVSAGYSDLTLPQGSLRGFDFDYYDFAPYQLNLFRGQRRLGFISGLSPSGQDNEDLFFSGGRLRYDAKPFLFGLTYAGASGEDRLGIQTSQAMAVESGYWVNELWRLSGELGRTQEEAYAYRLKSAFRQGAFMLDAVYRNFSQRYENLLGSSGDQGERGVLITASETPWSRLRLRQELDWHDDTLFRNPEEIERSNMELDLSGDFDLTQSTLWSSSYSRQRLLGRLFPTDSSTIRTGLRQRLGAVPLLTNGNLFADYQFRKARSVSSPSSDFQSHQVIFGLGASLTPYLSWQASQQWTLLEQTLSGDETAPHSATAGLNYSQQLRWVPLYLHSGINYINTSNAESANSFLSDEDRWTWDGGARYTLNSDSEAFVETRLVRTRQTTGREVEFQLETGMRVFLNTKIKWEPSLSISGIVFEDLNGDGLQGAGEAGMPQVAVQAGGAGAVRTDSGGRFYFGRVRGQMSEIAVDLTSLPEGYVATRTARTEVILSKPPEMPLLFGFVAQSELRARVYVDANANGQYDATDVPLDRIRITLDDGSSRVTDRSGWVFFRGIKPGAYQASVQVDDLETGYVPAGEVKVSVTLSEGKAELVDFAVLAQRSISGRVYVDRNRNARFDEEPVVKAVPVCLDGSRRAMTREDGGYLLKGVSAGAHRISINCSEPLAGLLPLNSATQVVELPPQPSDREGVDFRFGEKDAIMQDVISDVLKQRGKQEQLIESMIEQRKHSAR